ncbi:hypothetical protein K9M79_04375 [Candidatus Woesearchaeota archaeon]|nr:hypothetical protein [Candidatus Woesearchaeota archaeon]
MIKSLVKIIEITDETHDVKTFQTTKPEGFVFLPGQYIMASLKELPGETRPFTIASSPTQTELLFTVKKTGDFTGSMFELKVGDEFTIKGPLGKMLNFDDTVKDDVVFVAGGSGITPSLASLRYAADKGMKNKFTILYSNKEQKDIICKSELDSMHLKMDVEVVHCLTREKPEDWTEEIGRINTEMIKKHIKNPSERLWYICAPPPMVEAMKKNLEILNVPDNQIKTESWQMPAKG